MKRSLARIGAAAVAATLASALALAHREALADQVILKNGSLMEGEVLRQTDRLIVIRVRQGIELEFPLSEVVTVRKTNSGGGDGAARPPAATPTARAPKPPTRLLDSEGIIEAVKGASEADFADAIASMPQRRTEVVPRLVGLLSDADSLVRTRAAKALQAAPDLAAAQALSKALDDPWPPVREAAAIALGRLGSPAVGPLAERLGDAHANPVVLVRALGETRDPAAVGPILQQFAKAAPARKAVLAREAGEALARLGPQAAAQLEKSLDDEALAPLVLASLRARGDAGSVETLLRALAKGNPTLRPGLLDALASVQDPSASAALARAAASADAALARAAFAALERRSDAAAKDALLGIAESPAHPERVRAAAAAWRIEKPPRALVILQSIALNGTKESRLEAVRALGETGAPEAVPVLVKLLGGEDRALSAACREALARIQAPR